MSKKNVYIPESWSDVEEAYRRACSISCKPSDKFRRPKVGEVLDEDKSVRWNREEVERLRNEYDEEVKRLNREKNAAVSAAEDRAIRLIAHEAEVSEEKARILWNFVYDRYHAYGEMFNHIEDYIELICDMK